MPDGGHAARERVHNQRHRASAADRARRARVVKAFNTQFAGHMDTGQLGGQPLTVFAASDDAQAKQQVMEMAKGIGFTPIDAGPCGMRDRSSLWATSIFQLGYVLGLGTNIGLQLVRS